MPGHLDRVSIPGIEFSAGALGHGFSAAIGMAISNKQSQNSGRIFVLIGDGECNEGSVWETILSASQFNLDNLTVIVDRNNYQQTGKNISIMDLKNLKDKFISFGCDAYEIDGHDLKQIYKTLLKKNVKGKPKIIIANTIKGKGFKIFENDNAWHHSVITKSIYKNICKEL